MKSYLKLSALIACLIIAILASYVYYTSILTQPPQQQETRQPPQQEYVQDRLTKITIVDSAGRYVEVSWPVKRIAALTTDSAMAIVALGAGDRIVGISQYAVGEPWAPNVTNIGSSFSPNIEAIISVMPEVVVTYVRWPKPEDLESRLEPLGIKVVRLDFYRLETLLTEFKILGLMLNLTSEAEKIASYWEKVSKLIDSRVADLKTKVRVYWESYTDYTAAGPGTGWDDVLRQAGGINVFADSPVPYPKLSSEAIIERNPEVIIKSISSTKYNPYKTLDVKPLEEILNSITNRPGWSGIEAVKNRRVYLICAAYLHSVFGLIAEKAYVAKILYPQLFKDVDPETFLKVWIEDNLKMKWKEGAVWVYPSI